MMGRETQQARFVDSIERCLTFLGRSASRAKSIIMMAFFLTMPISRMMPISAMMLNSGAAQQQCQNCADARGGQRRENVMG